MHYVTSSERISPAAPLAYPMARCAQEPSALLQTSRICLLQATDQRLELLVVTATLYCIATSLVTCTAILHCPHVVCHAFPVSSLSWEVFVGGFKERSRGSSCLFSPCCLGGRIWPQCWRAPGWGGKAVQ